MTTYSGCRRCGKMLLVTSLDVQVCETCPRIIDPLDASLDQLSAAVNRFMSGTSDGSDLDYLSMQCERMEHAPPRLGDAAMAYAAWGWPVFPLRAMGCKCEGAEECQEDGCKCPKKPATRNGFQDATTDINQIHRWWSTNPAYNVGLATGVCFDAIDVDVASGGLDSWAALRTNPSLPDIHGRVLSARGGFHCYVEVSGGGNRAAIYPGIDYRGRGGYVVAPPSRLDTARKWTWSVYPSPRIIPARGGVVPQ